eukprot:TRINITY_DN15220_c0_g1_i1.p2 TRINITY_DN15220_c0_g1~~TRINITY_DN15220_c0_g1_i1.p2  ORF type:complete len:119 (+),score=22.66 TRINITY_DN15220_c0_g1_i1:92-448(+)
MATHGIRTYFGSGSIIPNPDDTPPWFRKKNLEHEDLGCSDEFTAAQQCIAKHRFQKEECYHRWDDFNACRERLWKARFPDSWAPDPPAPTPDTASTPHTSPPPPISVPPPDSQTLRTS